MQTYSSDQLASMSIFEVVKPSFGGNGLASAAFAPPKDFLIFGWQYVEKGVEAVLVNGERVEQTRLKADWWSLLRRNSYMRRVLLKPAPLTDLVATGNTRDSFQITLTVSVSYCIADPTKVTQSEAPMTEIAQAISGRLAEYIRSESTDNLFGDAGQVRQGLEAELLKVKFIREGFYIDEVLKVLVTGDERLMEIRRQTSIAEQSAGLINLEGNNRVIESQYDQLIARQQALLNEQYLDNQHRRDMDKQMAQLQSENARALLNAMTEIAKVGGNVSPDLFQKMMSISQPGQQQIQPPTPAQTPPAQIAQSEALEAERHMMESIRDAVGMQSFELFVKDGRLNGALIRMGTYDIGFQCSDGYPQQAPTVQVRFANGSQFTPQLTWIPAMNPKLAQAVTAIIPQAALRADQTNASNTDAPGSFPRLDLE